MATKRIHSLEVHDAHHDVRATIPVGIAEGDEDGPTLAVVGGVHGTEYAAHDGVIEFWQRLDPARLRGRVRVVLAADQTSLTAKSAYRNPVDGKNLNRVWPGTPDGTLTEVLAHAITTQVIDGADALIDVHGGEWDEAIDLFIITHRTGDEALDRRTLELALALGFPYVEVTEAGGAVLGRGTGSGTAMLGGTVAMTLEAGGEARRDRRHVAGVVQSLENACRHLGITDGPLTSWAGEPVVLDHGVLLSCKETGVLRPAVAVGDWIEAGELFTEVLDHEGTVLEQVRVDESGIVLDVITARGIQGGFVGKIGVCPPRHVDGHGR
jgi:predicted deacylase